MIDKTLSALGHESEPTLKKCALLIWTQYFWPENFQINQFAYALIRWGVPISVLTGKPNYPKGRVYSGYNAFGCGKESHSGIDIYRIPILPRGSNSLWRLLFNYISFVISGYIFAPWILRAQKITTILVYAPSPITQALPAIFFCWIRRIRLILWVQDLWPEVLLSMGFCEHSLVFRLADWLVRFIYNHSAVILIQSEAFRSSVELRVKDANKIIYFPNASDFAQPKSSTSESVHTELLTKISSSFSVVFTGNIGFAQSCETIVNAAEQLKYISDIIFYIIGDGSQAVNIKQLIQLKGLSNVVMVDALPAMCMPNIYLASSILLLTLRDQKAFAATIPSKLQSYMNAGKPIVASVNGVAARCVEQSGAGIVCPPDNPTALANSVLAIYNLREEDRTTLGLKGKEYALRHFNLDERIAELIKML